MSLAQVKVERHVRWRARLADGRVIMRDGTNGQWEAVPKDQVVQMELWHKGSLVLSQVPPEGVSLGSVIYRERITQSLVDNRVAALTYLIGWHPSGPYWAYDAETGQVHQAEYLTWGTLKGMFDPIGESDG